MELQYLSFPNVDIFATSGKFDNFAIDGDTMVLSSYDNYSGDTFPNSISIPKSLYTYNLNTGKGEKKVDLNNSSETPYEYYFRRPYGFSSSLAIDETSGIFAWGFSEGGGKVNIYKGSGELLASINNPSKNNNSFGYDIAFDKNAEHILIGAPGFFYNNQEVAECMTGKAYLYEVSTGKLVQTIDNPNTNQAVKCFGQSLGISGDNVVIQAKQSTYLYSLANIINNNSNSTPGNNSSDSPPENLDANSTPLIVNINAQKNNQNNPVIQSLAAGAYKVHVINTSEGGEFGAYDTYDDFSPIDCDANGANCTTGWETRYYYRSAKYHKIIDTSCTTEAHPSYGCHYSTAAKAAAHPPSDSEFTLSSQTDVKFYIYDSTLNNNKGGLSLEIIKQ